MEFAILAIGALAFWLIHGRNSDKPKPPMTPEEVKYWTSGQHNENAETMKFFLVIAVLTIPLGALLSPAIGLLAATVVAVLMFFGRSEVQP